MSVRYRVVTPPETQPVTLAEARQHTRVFVESEAEDAYLMGLVQSAQELTQSVTCRSWITQTYEARFDSWPVNGKPLTLWYPPLQTVDSITYGPDAAVWDPSDYVVIAGTPGEVRPAAGKSWPSQGPVVVEFVAGYGDDATDVPQSAKLAMLMLVCQWYEQRQPLVTGTIVAKLPFAVDALLSALKPGFYP